MLPTEARVFQPLNGTIPYNKKQVDDNSAYLAKVVDIFEKRLADFTYLVGERLTFADIFATLFVRGFDFLFGKEWRNNTQTPPDGSRPLLLLQFWLNSLVITVSLKNQSNTFHQRRKRRRKLLQESCCCSKKKEAAAPAASEEPAPAPKPKHPLEALGKPRTH